MPRPFRSMVCALLLSGSAALAAPTVFVAYPPRDYQVPYDHVILEGSVTPGAALKINGQGVSVGPDGLFMLWWPLKAGVNDLRLVATAGGQSGSASLRVTRTVVRILPATPTAIDRTSVTPRENLEYWDIARDTAAERTVQVSFNGSTGGRASFQVAGSAPQPMREGPAGTYSGSYVLPAETSVRNAAVSVRLTGKDGRTVGASAPGRLSSILGNLRTGVQRPGTVKGLGMNDANNVATTLDGAPFLYPRDGMTFTLVGRQGTDVRARLAPGLSILITEKQLLVTPGAPPLAASGPLQLEGQLSAPAATPASVVLPAVPGLPGGSGSSSVAPQQPSTLAPAAATEGATQPLPTDDLRLHIPLGGVKVPFRIEQSAPNQLQLTLYGVLTPPSVPTLNDPLLAGLTVVPGTAGTLLTLNLNGNQLWGFTANYQGSDLVLTVRRPPALDPARPLAGRVITLDPGHGGTQKGGAGSLRIPEKNLVLPLALRVAELLRAQGAVVNLTRTGDVTLGLYDRTASAEAAGSDLLVSIHANALPDGRNPAGVRGPEVYYTHPQAAAVAGTILKQLRARVPEIGPGRGLMPHAFLALTRPTTQISLLVETAYLTDAGNLRALHDPAARERFAQAIAAGISDFYQAQAK